MIAIGDQSSAVDFPTNLDTENGHGLIADETDEAGDYHLPEERDGLRMQEAVGRLVERHKRAEEDDADDCDSS